MNRVGKVVPPKRIILRDISLSFYPGAKIGVLGLNGSGKSTLLKIMSGMDKEIEGEARPQPGIKVGYLPQEPALDDSQTVRQVVGEGVGDVQKLIDRFNAISDKFAEEMSDDEMNKLMDEQAKMQDKIDAVNGWELERKLEIAADSLRLPPWESVIGQLSGGEKRRVALCRLLLSKPDMLLRSHSRSLLPRQRRQVDPRTRPRSRHPLGRQLLLLARAERTASVAGTTATGRAREDPQARTRVGAHQPESAPGEIQGPAATLRGTRLAGISEAQ
jgi:ABC-type multidrug transport system ATPase subunit